MDNPIKYTNEELLSQLDILIEIAKLYFIKMAENIDKDLTKDRSMGKYINQNYVINDRGLFIKKDGK